MRGRWFRLYDEILDDPKVQKLPGDLFKAWINIMAAASRHDGKVPIDDLPFVLRMDVARVKRVLRDLILAGLLDERDDDSLEPHNWRGRQFSSDVSTDRVRALRQRRSNGACNVSSTVSGNVSATASGTPPETDTDTDTDSPPTPSLPAKRFVASPSGAKARGGLASVGERLAEIGATKGEAGEGGRRVEAVRG